MNTSESWKIRYAAAHRKYQQTNTPNAVRDHGFLNTKFPPVETANGLTRFIVTYLDWTGCYGNRINTVGRKIQQKYISPTGKVSVTEKWIKGTTKKGTGDISAIVRGRAVTWEVKVGKDTEKDKQKEQKARIENAGGKYFFVRTPEQFFEQLDSLL